MAYCFIPRTQTERFLEGMRMADSFYSHEVVQVRTDAWSRGRVVLVGDAAHCASPFSGMGVSGALVGAYVLAGEINRHSGNLPTALAGYESALRPFVREIQKLRPFLLRIGIPMSHGVSRSCTPSPLWLAGGGYPISPPDWPTIAAVGGRCPTTQVRRSAASRRYRANGRTSKKGIAIWGRT